jgi:hypothetical protein
MYIWFAVTVLVIWATYLTYKVYILQRAVRPEPPTSIPRVVVLPAKQEDSPPLTVESR